MADWYFRNKQQNSLQTCPGCRNLVRKGEEFCPFCAKRLGPEGGWRGLAKRVFARPDSMTRLILGAMIVMFMVQMLTEFLLPARFRNAGGGGFMNFPPISTITYILLGANEQHYVYANHQYWRWFTYCFLHFGILHIVFNSWAMRDLGRLVEMLWGHRQVFSTFVVTGVFAGAVSFGWGIVLSGGPRISGGASGAICGLLGLLLGAYYKNRYHIGEHLGGQLLHWAVYILVFGLVAGADNAAHIGGMISGAALGYFLPPTRSTKTPDRDRMIWNILTGLAMAITLVSIGFAVEFAVGGMLELRGVV